MYMFKKMWQMIVKALTLGMYKMDNALDRATDPAMKLEQMRVQVVNKRKELIHQVAAVENQYKSNDLQIKKLQAEIDEHKQAALKANSDGDQQLAMSHARRVGMITKTVDMYTKSNAQIQKSVNSLNSKIDHLDYDKHEIQHKIKEVQDIKTQVELQKKIAGDQLGLNSDANDIDFGDIDAWINNIDEEVTKLTHDAETWNSIADRHGVDEEESNDKPSSMARLNSSSVNDTEAQALLQSIIAETK